ncbi:T9SS type A sorting domain-containing protein [Spirosoma validum]|uniref:T9SS type A sorting domain-containing protein n=1 Tax=Spirosoma validum TaxID=2771355 RepID=A0A927GG50_9BACT|nr:T9SS type A sorting domain-containing protein [Spirosoma validum]MBD2756235.1 T9SS type A sorting domain-containing protein [Spirosoma validum]
MVVQRNQANTASLYIAGTFSIPVDRIETRLVPTSTTSRIDADWLILHDQPKNGLFKGSIIAPSGLFRLEVRGIRDDKTVSSASVPVGIGEVFVIAGQSNAMGLPNLGAKGASERVVVFNAWNRFWNKNDALESSDKPFPAPTFSTLTASSLVYPTGETAWCWGELGDYIADRYNVPVAFFNVAIPATVAENWSNSAKGIPAKNIFNSTIWPFLQPYSNLRNTLQYYNSQFGIRAILWHHGESDAVPLHTPTETYRQDIQYLIDNSRTDFGRNMTWVVARSSITPAGPTPSPEIIQAQLLLAKTLNNNVWEGPDTDSIQSPRPAHGHFENIPNGAQGISAFANAWKKNLNDQFFKGSQPHQPQQFIQTGLVPSEIPAGTPISVPYEIVGFSNKPDVAVQLLTEKGLFVAEIGRDKGNSSVRVYLSDTLSQGNYQLRVIATNPLLAGALSLPFKIVSPNLPLNPFRDVQIERSETTTFIHWLTAQEPVGSRFTIERRDSIGTYQSIGTMTAITDNQLSHLYSFVDPIKNSPETSYRIRLEQPDGRVQFSSQLVLASANEPLPQPIIYPNPSDGTSVTLSLPRSGQWNLTLINLKGQIIWQQRITTLSNQATTVPLASDLATGSYQLQLQNADQYFTKQVLIQR